ncbi:MAG: hypothetical protein ACFFDI_19070 [Promethearchaeota archaeon]
MTFNETRKMQIEDLNPFDRYIEVNFKIISKGEIQEITSKRSGETHSLCNITVADSTAAITLTLWEDDIELVEEDKVYTLSNGYVNVHRNSMRLSKGKYGTISPSDATIDEVNIEDNLSERYVEGRRRRTYRNNYNQYGPYSRNRRYERDRDSYRW